MWSVVTIDQSESASKVGDGTRSVPATVVELACNLANRTESDLRVPEPLMKLQQPTVLAGGWFTRPIWFYLVGLAWLVAVVEWFLYQRRYIS